MSDFGFRFPVDLEALDAKLQAYAEGDTAQRVGVHNLRSPFTWAESAALVAEVRRLRQKPDEAKP